MAVSITDIARELGISPSTVSRVLNGKGTVSDELRIKIHKTAKRLNYIPNVMARNLQQQSSNTVGVIVPDITDDFFGNVVRGIESVLSELGYPFFLCDTGENRKKEEKYIDLLYENRVAGLLVATVRNDIPSEDRLFSGGIPVCFFDNTPRLGKDYNCVITDNYEVGRQAAAHLIQNGHTQIAAIMGKQVESTGKARFEGFLDELRKNGVPYQKSLYKFCDFKEESGRAAMRELLEQKENFTAVFIASSKMVYGAMYALREAGKRIPKDISILGVDIVDKYQIISPGITSVIQEEFEIGKSAAELLVDKIQNPGDKRFHQIFLEPKLLKKDSILDKNK